MKDFKHLKGFDVSKEKIIKDYFTGWEQNDWNQVENLLADGFTFTSPNGNDDHLNTQEYKKVCWPWPDDFKKFIIHQIFTEGEEAFVRYQIVRNNGTAVNNSEYMLFEDGKIKEVQVYFGRSK